MPRGGRRPGAGRKRKPRVFAKRATAAELLASVDEKALWMEQLTASRCVLSKNGTVHQFPDHMARHYALVYLTDRRDGKAPQSITLTDMTKAMEGRTDAELMAFAKTGQWPGSEDGKG